MASMHSDFFKGQADRGLFYKVKGERAERGKNKRWVRREEFMKRGYSGAKTDAP
jgi:hypothetical protein